MLRKILSRVSNSKKAQAKRETDWWFHEEPSNTMELVDNED